MPFECRATWAVVMVGCATGREQGVCNRTQFGGRFDYHDESVLGFFGGEAKEGAAGLLTEYQRPSLLGRRGVISESHPAAVAVVAA